MLKYHIQTIEVGSGGASAISFSSIPQTYDDLYLVISARSTGTGYGIDVAINGTTSNYTYRTLEGNGSVGSSFPNGGGGPTRFFASQSDSGNTASTFGSSAIYIPNYRSNLPKSISTDTVTETNATTAFQNIISALWNNTSPVNSIILTAQNGNNFAQYSSASLYGVKSGSDGKTLPAAQGGTVTTSGGYTIHTFTSSGTFTTNRPLEVEYLVIAGGGGGGSGDYYGGGGGGAGGYRCSVTGELSGGGTSPESKLNLYPQSYSVIVGAGGTGGTTVSGANAMTGVNSGSNSEFASIVSVGGGFGGGKIFNNYDGGNGGSGGGSNAEVPNVYNPGGLNITGQGYPGGSGWGNGVNFGDSGGGGGAGSAGSNGSNIAEIGGNGGNGLSSSITGSSVTRAGGGGGGTNSPGGTQGLGGSGGGGNASASTPGAGAANTGSGGGGKSSTGTGAAGGSGIVIIRYPTPA